MGCSSILYGQVQRPPLHAWLKSANKSSRAGKQCAGRTLPIHAMRDDSDKEPQCMQVYVYMYCTVPYVAERPPVWERGAGGITS